MAMSLDHISGGRMNLGIGAGWFEAEHKSFGLDFKSVRGRLDALEESLQIVKGMLAGESVTLDGEHYKVTDAFCNPSPVQPGGLPIMIGGEGKRILLRIVAQYADMWNAFGTPEKMGGLIEIIRKHGDTVGRDTDEIEKTAMLPLCYTGDKGVQDAVVSLLAASFGMSPEDARGATMIGEAQECIDTVERFREAGVTHFIFMCFAPYPADQIQAFAEQVMPAFRS
jgi:alkanesulfonate monooxygenase SsuD/methylene tetrahydromethanopterin reductase-like flavin-dependent oxidoreductase (luciferase family)